MIETLPVFSVRPDWSTPVRESMEWKTNVMRSQIGAEQRASLRLTARRRQEVPITAFDREHQYYQALLSIEPQGRYYVPLWFERSVMVQPSVTGGNQMVIDGNRREIGEAAFIFIQGRSPNVYEIQEVAGIASVDGTTQFLIAGTFARDWPPGTPVYPLYSAIIESANATQFTRAGARIIQGSVRFLFDKPFDWESQLDPPLYLDQPVFEMLSNENGEQSGDFSRILGSHDGDVGVVTQTDLGGKAFPGFMANNWVHGRTNNEQLRDFIYYMNGRQKHGWWVHPTDDFFLVAPITNGDTQFQVVRGGVSDLGVTSSREHIRVLLRDGTAIYRQLASAVALDDNTDGVNVTVAFDQDISQEDVVNIRYISQGRLDQDLISFDHHTDQDGITEYNLGVRFIPEVRVADDWDPPDLPDTTEHEIPCLVGDDGPYIGPP